MKKFKFLGVLIIAAMMALALLACQDDKPPKIPDEEIEVNLADLKITVHPEKLIYNVGEDFEPGELEVTAIYSDKTEKVIPHNQLTITPKSFTAAGPNVEVTISYRESNIAKQVSEWVVVNALADELYSIAVTNPPSKTDYVAGDLFIPIGLSVLATYNSGGEAGKLTTKSIPVGDARLSYRPEGPLPAGATTLTVICTENGVSKSATVSITVATIVGLQITSPPEKDRYNAGEAFDKTGMEVTALFLNGEKPPMVVNPSLYTVEPAVLTGTETEVMVKYSGESESVPVAVVSNITIETPPTKELLYNSGDTFKPDGMVLNVEYTDGVVVKETIAAGMAECTPENVPTPTNPDGTVVITIKYRGKTTTIPVEVVTVVSVKISKQPGKTTYYSGDPFITGGMEVEAEYSNGDKKLVSFSNDPADGYNYSPREVKTGRDIVITYGGKAVVVEGLNVIAMVLQVESGTYKANYKAGETFNAAGMKVYKGFMDGPGGTVGTKTEIPAAQYQVVTPGVLSATNKTVKVRYDGEESDVPIRVGVLSALEVTPGKTAYLEGKLFETTGMVVRAVYSDGEGSDGVVLRETKSPGATGYTISNPSFLAPAETSVSVVYTDFGVTKSEPVTITVSAFVDFEFTPASSGVYYEGDTFDPKDLEVRAVYANGEKELLSHGANGYRVNGSVNYTEKMRAGNTFFTVSYPVGNRPTAPSTFRWIKVYPVTAVTVEGAFAKTYLDGIDKFNRAGMTVKATYDVDGTPETKVITDYTWTDSILTAANKVVTVSYMGKEFRIEDITILTLRSVTATLKNPSYEYIISGDTLEKSDMVVAAVYGAGEGAGEITSSINNVPAGDYEINIAGDRLSAAAGVQNSFTVTYKGMTSSPVGIMVKQVVGFTVTGPKVYYVGDRVQKDDLTVTIAYNRGTSPEVIPSSGFAVTPTAALAVGDTIEVVYKGLTRKTDIVVGENVGLNLTTVPLTPGGTYTLTSARLAGLTAVWTSSNEAVATVAGGVITATGEGTATIYVVAGAYVGWCTVVVAPPTAISTVAEFLAIFELRTGGNNSANATTWASASNSSQTAATTKRASHYYLTADLDFANCRVGTTNYTAASPYPYTRPVTVNAEPQRYNAAGTDTDWNWSADATDQMYLDALGSPTQQGRLWFIDHQSFFNGTFDGRGYALKNITMSVDATGSVGVYGFSIFGVIGKSGVVKNVSFENFTCLQATATSTIAAQNAVVAHHNHGTIQDCYFSGVRINSKGGDAFGHNAVIAAFNYNKIDRCVVASAATSVSGTGATNYQRLYPTVVMTRRNGTSVGDVTNTFALMDLMAGTTLSIPGSSYTNGFTVTEFAAYPAKTINLLVTPLRPFDMRESTFNNLRMVWRSATTTLPTSDTSAGHCVRLSAANFTALSAGAYWTFPSGAMPKLVPAPAA